MTRTSLLVALVLAGCRKDPIYEGAFVLPSAAAVLHPETGGPMADHEPVGFVANGTGGRIVLLALKQGRFLNDDATASFLRTNDLPTGGLRLLQSVAPYAPEPYDVVVYAGDAAFEQLVEVPWVIGSETSGGVTVPVEGYASWFPPVSSNPDVTLTRLEVKTGYTASERWTLTSDGATWDVVGSRSGRQPTRAEPGVAWSAEERRVNFIVNGPGTEGDTITVDTWNGLVEHDVGGTPTALAMAADQSVMAMVVHDAALDRPVVRWFDPASRRVLRDVALPPDARPHRLELSEDGDRLFVSDRQRPAVWEVSLGSTGAVEHLLPEPSLDVAHLLDDQASQPRDQLFVASADGRTLYRYDLLAGGLVDANPWVAGVQGLVMDSPITGVGANRLRHLFTSYDQDGQRMSGRTVAVSLAKGAVVFADEASGCLVQDNLGPRTTVPDGSRSLDYAPNYENPGVGGPYLEPSGASSRSVQVNPCGGVALSDSWSLTYDENAQHWVVESELFGTQVRPAYEDQRYISDRGEVSFTLRAGLSPSVHGMEILFGINAGVAIADGDNDRDGTREAQISGPGDPVPFHYEVGPRDGDWYVVDDRPLVLVLGSSSDTVLRVDPQEADVDVAWQ